MGYASNSLQSGAKLVTPQFLGINGTGAVDLQTLKCNEGCSDSVFIMTLDEIGLTVDTYGWVDYGGDSGDEECWLDMNTAEKAEGVTFQPGQALWIQGDTEDQGVTSAGQVGTADVAVQLRSGATLAGNPTPVAIDIQDIVCNEGCSDSVFIMTLDEIGLTVDTYGWVDYGGDSGDEECWLDMNTAEKAVGVMIQPGQGLWIQGDSDEQIVTFPGVEL